MMGAYQNVSSQYQTNEGWGVISFGRIEFGVQNLDQNKYKLQTIPTVSFEVDQRNPIGIPKAMQSFDR